VVHEDFWSVMMWTGTGTRRGFCDGITRRDVLRIGMLTGFGFSAGTAGLRSALGRDPATRRAAIHIFLGGGASHFETLDPKPEAPSEIRGPYSPIATSLPGIQFCETLPKLAAIADQFSIIRSCCHDNPGHGGGQRYVHTGYKSASLENELPHDYPAVGCVVAKVRGAMQDGLPTFMQSGNGNDSDPAFLGPAYAPFQVYSTGKPVGQEIHPHLKLARLEDRRALREKFDQLQRWTEAGRIMDSMDELERQALEMLSSTRAHEAFDLSKESEMTRQQYGLHDAGRCCLLARRFIEAGAGFVSMRIGSWDHHGNAGGTVTSGMRENAPPMDQAVSTLIADLQERGLSERVLVLLWGEFGRTPRINSSFGRDHWPQAGSVLLAGGGLRSGAVIGATNRKGEYPVDRPVSPADVIATVYRQLGIDPEESFINTSGRPIPILSHGRPIEELL